MTEKINQDTIDLDWLENHISQLYCNPHSMSGPTVILHYEVNGEC